MEIDIFSHRKEVAIEPRFSYIAKTSQHLGLYMALSTVAQAVVNLLGLRLLTVRLEPAALSLALPGWLFCQAWSCFEKAVRWPSRARGRPFWAHSHGAREPRWVAKAQGQGAPACAAGAGGAGPCRGRFRGGGEAGAAGRGYGGGLGDARERLELCEEPQEQQLLDLFWDVFRCFGAVFELFST